MIRFNNEPFLKAVEDSGQPKSRLAILAYSSTHTFNKVLEGDTDMQLTVLGKIADYLGLDVEIHFVKRNNGSNEGTKE
jgi:hypothetical protein